MVWTAVLLVLLLVPGGSEASNYWICDETTAQQLAAGDLSEDQLSLRGFFVDPARQTRVFLRVRLNEEKVVPSHECFLQHEDGPRSPAGGTRMEFMGRCRDPVTGRDHATLSTSSGGNSGLSLLQYWSVQPDTQQMTLEYRDLHGEEDPAFEDERELLPRPSSVARPCLWGKHQKATETFYGAMAALGTGTKLDEKALDLEVGATRTLPAREISDEVLRHWLRALLADPLVRVTFETAWAYSGSADPAWRLLQILGQRTCDAPGVVLLQDTRSGQWRSIYDVHSGCSKVTNFPLYDMRIAGDTLFAKFCTDCIYWGQYGTFTLNLLTNRVTRLEEAEGSWGENASITDPLAFVDQGGKATPRAEDAAR